MPNYSNTSKKRLVTAHPDLITVFDEVIRIFDNTILYGYRPPEHQFILFQKGRKYIDGKWAVKDRKKVVTYCDGRDIKSDHNELPSRAVDAVPYPVEWKNTDRMYYFAGHVKMIAIQLLKDGKVTHSIGWGGDWDSDSFVHDQNFMDLAHYYII